MAGGRNGGLSASHRGVWTFLQNASVGITIETYCARIGIFMTEYRMLCTVGICGSLSTHLLVCGLRATSASKAVCAYILLKENKTHWCHKNQSALAVCRCAQGSALYCEEVVMGSQVWFLDLQ